jgi:hypothetical protein
LPVEALELVCATVLETEPRRMSQVLALRVHGDMIAAGHEAGKFGHVWSLASDMSGARHLLYGAMF